MFLSKCSFLGVLSDQDILQGALSSAASFHTLKSVMPLFRERRVTESQNDPSALIWKSQDRALVSLLSANSTTTYYEVPTDSPPL